MKKEEYLKNLNELKNMILNINDKLEGVSEEIDSCAKMALIHIDEAIIETEIDVIVRRIGYVINYIKGIEEVAWEYDRTEETINYCIVNLENLRSNILMRGIK